jgi:hypothetical protein
MDCAFASDYTCPKNGAAPTVLAIAMPISQLHGKTATNGKTEKGRNVPLNDTFKPTYASP